MVAHKHGEKSAQTLSAAGFRNLMFRTYNGYVILPSLSKHAFIFCSFSNLNPWFGNAVWGIIPSLKKLMKFVLG